METRVSDFVDFLLSGFGEAFLDFEVVFEVVFDGNLPVLGERPREDLSESFLFDAEEVFSAFLELDLGGLFVSEALLF